MPNVPPQLATSGSAANFIEGNNVTSTRVAVDGGLTVSDADSATLASATVAITGNFHSGEDILSFTNNPATMGNISASYNSTTGIATFTSSGATATLAQWQSALRAVTYTDTSDTPSTSNRTVSFTVDDGTSVSPTATRTVTVAAANDSPIVTTDGGSAAFTAADNATSTSVVVDSAIVVSDADNATLASATVAIAGNFHGSEDVLSFTNNPATMGNISASYNSTTGVATLTSSGATATLAQWQSALRAVTYTDTAVTPDTATRTISITANDGTSDSATATRPVTVADTDQTPIGVNDSYATDENTPLIVATPGLLANDTDRDSNSLSATFVSGPAHGSLTLFSDGSMIYSPGIDFTGSDSFIYRASDGVKTSAPATVSLTVNAVNHAPVAVNDSYATDENTSLTVATPGLLGNDTDQDGDPIVAIIVSGPAHGSLTLNSNGSLIYSPGSNFTGSDSFTYKARDGTADSGLATVSLTVNPVDLTPPVVSSITPGTSGPMTASTLDETVVFSEPVTGVDAGDFSLTATGTATATIGTVAAVSGSPGTYTVGLTGVSGHGTLRLDLKNSGTGIEDGASNAIQAGFTSGGTTTVQISASSGGGSPGPSTAVMTGTSAADVVIGLAADDTISSGSGDDLVLGRQGNDVIEAGNGADTVYGGQDDDSITVGNGNDLLFGNEGADTVHTGNGNNTVVGGQDSTDGADLLMTGGGNDLIYGNGGADMVAAGAGADSVVGGFGNDRLLGNQGNDLMLGNQGADMLSGGQGNDTLVGGQGDDTLVGNQGDDMLFGNEGANSFGFNIGDTDFVSGTRTGDTIGDFKSGQDKVLFAGGPTATAANFGAAAVQGGSFAALQAAAQTLIDGGDAYAFASDGQNGYLFADETGDRGIDDAVKLGGLATAGALTYRDVRHGAAA